MTTAMRTVYAQSSDIRSRTWTQYRLDMKKKAIAELEFLPFLQRLLAARHNDSSVRVRKHGGDALLWFAPKGRVSQDPDYQASWSNGKSCSYEFQLAEATEKLRLFDFKGATSGTSATTANRAAKPSALTARQAKAWLHSPHTPSQWAHAWQPARLPKAVANQLKTDAYRCSRRSHRTKIPSRRVTQYGGLLLPGNATPHANGPGVKT